MEVRGTIMRVVMLAVFDDMFMIDGVDLVFGSGDNHGCTNKIFIIEERIDDHSFLHRANFNMCKAIQKSITVSDLSSFPFRESERNTS